LNKLSPFFFSERKRPLGSKRKGQAWVQRKGQTKVLKENGER